MFPYCTPFGQRVRCCVCVPVNAVVAVVAVMAVLEVIEVVEVVLW